MIFISKRLWKKSMYWIRNHNTSNKMYYILPTWVSFIVRDKTCLIYPEGAKIFAETLHKSE